MKYYTIFISWFFSIYFFFLFLKKKNEDCLGFSANSPIYDDDGYNDTIDDRFCCTERKQIKFYEKPIKYSPSKERLGAKNINKNKKISWKSFYFYGFEIIGENQSWASILRAKRKKIDIELKGTKTIEKLKNKLKFSI